MQVTALPAIVIVVGILVAYGFAGLSGVGIAVMAMLSMAGIVVAIGSAALAAVVLFASFVQELGDRCAADSALACS